MRKIPPSFGRSLLALILGAMGIGLAPIFVRCSEVGPISTAFWRLILALPVFLVWTFSVREKSALPNGRFPWFLLIFAGASFAGDLAIWHKAVRLTSVANATLETNFSAIFVPLILWFSFGKKISGRFLLAMLAAVIGTVLLVGRNAHLSPSTFRGDLLGIASAVFYSGYLLSVKAARDCGLGTAVIMIGSGIIASAVLYLVALLSRETILPPTLHAWIILLGLAMVAQVGGQTLIAYALAGLPASFASLGLLVQPATATLAAWVLLGESLGPAQFVGCMILLLGLWMAQRAALKT